MSIQKQFPLDYLLANTPSSQYQKDSIEVDGVRSSLQFDSHQVDDYLVDQCHVLADGLRKAEEKIKTLPRGDVDRNYLEYFVRVNSRKLQEIQELLTPESPSSHYRI